MKSDQILADAKRLSPTSIALLRRLRQAVYLDDWKVRQTVQANRMGLLRLHHDKLTLTAAGRKVADLL